MKYWITENEVVSSTETPNMTIYPKLSIGNALKVLGAYQFKVNSK